MLRHFNKYPKMKIQDLVKLVYQNEFAGGHFVENENESLERLKAEIRNLTDDKIKDEKPVFEDIGNGLVRLYLNNVPGCGADLKTINRFFVATSNSVHGSTENFEKKADVLRQCCRDGLLPFTEEETDKIMKELALKGYPPISHSEEYKKEYDPHYRVVKSEFMNFFDVFASIDSMLKTRETVKVAIDGSSGAGKSFLAGLLGEVYDCNVFHMDDFFLTPWLRTEERLKEPGGNVDYVRFRDEVLDKIKEHEMFSYRKFNCSKCEFEDPVRVLPKRVNIIEGCYSLHPYLIEDYDLKIFLHTGRKKQIERILQRNGPVMLERFVNEWIPLEDEYFEKLNIPGKCDLVYEL